MTAPAPHIASLADEIPRLCQDAGWRFVLAESCTAGLVAATVGRIPGVSEAFCGSLVTYRNSAKEKWLGIAADELDDPGPVSGQVAASMARGALSQTPEASIGAVITGHLGPNAPRGLDGRVFVGVAWRDSGDSESCVVLSHRLPPVNRGERQRLAALCLLECLHRALTAAAAHRRLAEESVCLVGLGPRTGNSISAECAAVLSGSFNPLHHGHSELAAAAAQHLGRSLGDVHFEIPVANADKAHCDRTDLIRRALQFSPQQQLWFSSAGPFHEKCLMFPEAVFVVGIDTVERIARSGSTVGPRNARKRWPRSGPPAVDFSLPGGCATIASARFPTFDCRKT